MGLTYLSLFAAAALGLAACWELAAAGGRRSELVRRIAGDSVREGTPARALERLGSRLARRPIARRVTARFAAAGMTVTPIGLVVGLVLVPLLVLVLASLLGSPLLTALLTVLGVLGVQAWLNRRIQQRRERFVAQLPDLARLLSNAANAGLALKSGIELASREIGEPAQSELRRVTEAMAVGYSLDEALADMTHRLPSREVAVLISTLVVQQRSGGRIISALQNVALTLDSRKEVRREIRTLIAGALSSTYIVMAIGLGSILLLNLVNPGSLDAMAASNIGRLVLGFSGSLYALGFFLVRRMIRIEP